MFRPCRRRLFVGDSVESMIDRLIVFVTHVTIALDCSVDASLLGVCEVNACDVRSRQW
jgi:hypothetical protein